MVVKKHRGAAGGGGVWGKVRRRLASKISAISVIGERKAFISAIVICCAYEIKDFPLQ